MRERISATPKPRRAAGSPSALRVLYSDKQIRKRVLELARQIDRDYKGKVVHVVGILGGCSYFLTDLTRALKVPLVCHFIQPEIRESTVGNRTVQEIRYAPRIHVGGKHVLLVDGVIQSGVMLDHLIRSLLAKNAVSVRAACLVDKVAARKVDVATDYVGFTTPAKFVVGYGLSYEGRFHNLPYVAQLRRVPAARRA